MRAWIDEQRGLSGRLPRRYASIEDAWKRMQEENKHLSPEQARHLTQHGVNQNEDGTYSWKFDNYVRSWPPYDMALADVEGLWARIACPTLLVYGKESWASNPGRGRPSQAFPQRGDRHLRGGRPLGAPRQAGRVHDARAPVSGGLAGDQRPQGHPRARPGPARAAGAATVRSHGRHARPAMRAPAIAAPAKTSTK